MSKEGEMEGLCNIQSRTKDLIHFQLDRNYAEDNTAVSVVFQEF